MSEKSDKYGKNTEYQEKPGSQFKKGNPGKPKGAKHKIPQTAKQNIEETFKRLGGVEGLIKWAKKSNYNMTKIYDWYFSMLPKNVDANIKGQIESVVFMMPRPKENKKDNGNTDK